QPRVAHPHLVAVDAVAQAAAAPGPDQIEGAAGVQVPRDVAGRGAGRPLIVAGHHRVEHLPRGGRVIVIEAAAAARGPDHGAGAGVDEAAAVVVEAGGGVAGEFAVARRQRARGGASEAAAVAGGGVAGEGVAVQRQRPLVVDAAAAAGAGGVAAEDAVVHRQRAGVEQAATVVVATAGDGQAAEGHGDAREDPEDPVGDAVGVVAADGQVGGAR